MIDLENLIKNNFYLLNESQKQELLKEVEQYLKENKISNLKLIGQGESSLVFESDDTIIKITFMEYDNHKSLKEYVSHSKHILQPFKEDILDVKIGVYSAKILFSKKLSTQNITNEDVLNMYFKLRDDGYLWNDTKKENIGRDENGNLFLIDYGELIYINDLDLYKRNLELKSHIVKKAELNEEYKKYRREKSMTQEQIERLARYATDKYFDCKSPETKEFLTSDTRAFMDDYIRVFEVALNQIKTNQDNKFQEFGTEENAKAFK